MRLILAAGTLAFLSGCASITTDSTQLIRVDALDENGEMVADAACVLKNDKGEYNLTAGEHRAVRKSSQNLNVSCKANDREDEAVGTVISRVGAGMFGNLVFGGGVGAIIDHTRGTAYNYPEWIQLVFGKILTFDRSKHKEGVPMTGMTEAEVKMKKAETEE